MLRFIFCGFCEFCQRILLARCSDAMLFADCCLHRLTEDGQVVYQGCCACESITRISMCGVRFFIFAILKYTLGGIYQVYQVSVKRIAFNMGNNMGKK